MKSLIAGGVLAVMLLAGSTARAADTGYREVTANGITFRYLEAGKGPLVLCLHGFPDTPHTWDGLLPVLAKSGYRAVAPSLRGYAPSSAPKDGDYSMLALGEDVLALMDALGEKKAIVIGHDWGALAAYMAANLAPDRVEKLVTLAIPHPRAIQPLSRGFLNKSWHFFFYGLTPWIPEKLLEKPDGWGSIPWIYRRWSPDWRPSDDELADVERAFAESGSGPLDYYRSFAKDQALGALRLGARARLGRRVLFARTSAPALTILGKRDGALGLRDPERTREAFTSSYTLVALDCGHFIQRERPKETADAILDFLGRPMVGAAGALGAR